MKTYRIAAIGFAHSHMRANLEAFASCGERVKFVAAADVPPRIPSLSVEPDTRRCELDRAVEQYGFRKYEDYRQLLEENEIDIALVCCENAYHPVVMETILRRGIHVVVEKPLAATMQGAMRIARAARESGAKVFTNWPVAWSSAVRQAKELCDAGEIGRLFKFTFRNSDSLGPLSYGQQITELEKGREWWHQADVGGGAVLDYCCYGACMAPWFLNSEPVSAYGLKANFDSPYASAEDYAEITVRFPRGVAILEGSWTTVNTGIPNGPILYGTEGTMVVNQSGAIEIYCTRHAEAPDRVIEPMPLPDGRDNLGREVLHHLDTGEELFQLLELKTNLSAISILDAGSRSAESGKMELANDAVWTVGTDPFL